MNRTLSIIGLRLSVSAMRLASAETKAKQSAISAAELIALRRDHEALRETYRAALEVHTGMDAALIERALAL